MPHLKVASFCRIFVKIVNLYMVAVLQRKDGSCKILIVLENFFFLSYNNFKELKMRLLIDFDKDDKPKEWCYFSELLPLFKSGSFVLHRR